MRIGFTVVAIAVALPAVLASYWDGSSCTYEGPSKRPFVTARRPLFFIATPTVTGVTATTATAAAVASVRLPSTARLVTPISLYLL
ncbi:hypothetical protein NHJ13051_007266 [Beauveria bassiana]